MKNEERVTATRTKLIDAAISALAEIGYHRTTFVEVSRRSELSRGAIHHHFDSVPDLMSAVVQDLSLRIRADISTGLQHLAQNAGFYEDGIDFVWDQMRGSSYLALDQIRSAITTDPELRNSVSAGVGEVAQWLEQRAHELVSASTDTDNTDPAIVQILLTTLAGAAACDAAMGAPSEDPERLEFRRALKRMVKLAIAERATNRNNQPEPA